MSASFSGGWTPEAKRAFCERCVQLCEEADFMKQATALGWIGSDVLAAMIAKLRAEGTDPVSFSRPPGARSLDGSWPNKPLQPTGFAGR